MRMEWQVRNHNHQVPPDQRSFGSNHWPYTLITHDCGPIASPLLVPHFTTHHRTGCEKHQSVSRRRCKLYPNHKTAYKFATTSGRKTEHVQFSNQNLTTLLRISKQLPPRCASKSIGFIRHLHEPTQWPSKAPETCLNLRKRVQRHNSLKFHDQNVSVIYKLHFRSNTSTGHKRLHSNKTTY